MVNQISLNTPNKTTFAPWQSNGAPYAIVKPFTEQQQKEVEKEKEKKIKKFGVGLATTAVTVGFGLLILLKGLPKGARLNAEKFFQGLNEKIAKLKDTTKTLSGPKIFYLNALEKVKSVASKLQAVFNLASIYDVSFKQVTDHTPVLKTFLKPAADFITNLFEKISVNTSKSAYNKTATKLDDMFAHFADVDSRIQIPYQDGLNIKNNIIKIDEIYKTKFSRTPRDIRLKETNKKLERLDKQFIETIRKKPKDLYQTFIPESLVKETKDALANEVNPAKKEIIENIKDILNIYKPSLSPKEYSRMEKRANKLIKSLNNAIDLETDKLFDKVRDLHLGSAPRDVLSVLGSIGVVGWFLSKADNKDEKTSVALKYGLPAIVAVMTSLYCTVGLIATGPSLIIGAAAGIVIKALCEYLDKVRKNYNEQKPNLSLSNIDFNSLGKIFQVIDKNDSV